MDAKEAFIDTLNNTKLMALATQGESGPNVRIMDFLFDADAKKIYFPTSSRSHKIQELENNNAVALTTIPQGPGAVIRIQHAKAEKSSKTIADVKDALIAKREPIQFMLQGFGETGVVYEIAITGGVMIEKGKPTKVEL